MRASNIAILLTGAVVALVSFIHPSIAKTVQLTLVKSASPTYSSTVKAPANVLGIYPGKTVDQVKKILSTDYGKPTIQKSSISLNYRSIQVTTQKFISEMEFKTKKGSVQDSIKVYFSTPVLGDVVVAVARIIHFNGELNSPTIVGMKKDLVAKYGPMSGTIDERDSAWFFNAQGKHVLCSGYDCGATYDGTFRYSGRERQTGKTYAHLVANGQYVQIHVWIGPADNDPTRVGGVAIYLGDIVDEAMAVKQMGAQLHKAALAAYKKKAVPSVPKL